MSDSGALRLAVNAFAEEAIPNSYIDSLSALREGKAIHDPIWGTHVYSPFEMGLIDSPLMQRLRGLHQTSLAYLVYPAATHTRFEHSLGVVAVAEKLLDALNATTPVVKPHETERLTVRLAALLHDCGHTLLSHIGEYQISTHEWILECKADGRHLGRAKPHEMLSYLVVTSPQFRKLFDKLKSLYAPGESAIEHVDVEEVAGFIVGNAKPYRQYLADIINGSFDADKLDYLIRDSYFTGLRLTLDIDRLLHAMTVRVIDQEWLERKARGPKCVPGAPGAQLDPNNENLKYKLVVRSSGVTALEQILFSKMQLFAGIYHHHKVRAADSVLTSYVEYLRSLPEDKQREAFENGAVPLLLPDDFLKYVDGQWLHADVAHEDYLGSIASRVLERRLFKRVLVISRATVPKRLGRLTRFQRSANWERIYAEIRAAVIELLDQCKPGHGLSPFDIVVDLPLPPSLREAEQTPVLMPNGSVDVLMSFFPIDKWLNTYLEKKWQGHVFCPDIPELRPYVAAAAKKVLETHPELGLQFEDTAVEYAHIDAAALPTI